MKQAALLFPNGCVSFVTFHPYIFIERYAFPCLQRLQGNLPCYKEAADHLKWFLGNSRAFLRKCMQVLLYYVEQHFFHVGWLG